MKKVKLRHEIKPKNVFAELGFENPEEMLAKAELTRQIYCLINKKKLSKTAAARLLNIDQKKLSDLILGRSLGDFSLLDLFKFLNILGQEIIIKVKPIRSSKQKAHVTVDMPTHRKKSVIIPQDISPNVKTVRAKKRK